MENISFSENTPNSVATSVTDPNETPIHFNTNSSKESKIDSATTEENSEFQAALQKVHLLKGRKSRSATTGIDIDDHKGSNGIDKFGKVPEKEIFFLENRQLVLKPETILNDTEEGKVVVEIIVDENGKVISALPGLRGSTTTSALLYKRAVNAAYTAKFNPSKEGIREQRGTYTFVFTLE